MELTLETSGDKFHKPSISKKTYTCSYEGCTASFSKNSKLVYHIKRHTGERPFACDEAGCGKTYLYSFHLRRHKQTHQDIPKVEKTLFPCTFEGCHRELASKSSLNKHLKMKHDPTKYYPFTCNECQQGFHRKRQLLQHSYIHTGVFPFKCETCGTKFRTDRDRNRHKRTHARYPCKCGQIFERWSQLLAHKKLCEVAKPKCNVCYRTFTDPTNLKTHVGLLHLGEEATYMCGYDNCTRSYSYKRNLVYHINTYHKKIPLPHIACTHEGCTKTFTQNQKLKIHLKACHSINSSGGKTKTPRRPRKDKGSSRKSMAAVLAGLELPRPIHKALIQGSSVEVPLIAVRVTENKQNCVASEDKEDIPKMMEKKHAEELSVC